MGAMNKNLQKNVGNSCSQGCGQQVEGGDSTPLCCSVRPHLKHLSSLGVPAPGDLPEGHGENPEGYQDDQRNGEGLLGGKAGRIGVVPPEDCSEVTSLWPCST